MNEAISKRQTIQGFGPFLEGSVWQGKRKLGGGFKHFLFSPLLGEMIQFDYINNIYQMG